MTCGGTAHPPGLDAFPFPLCQAALGAWVLMKEISRAPSLWYLPWASLENRSALVNTLLSPLLVRSLG